MEAKNQAENAEASADVERILGEGGPIGALRDAIADAKKTRMVKRGVISKAEAVLPEVTADLKRILADKKAAEKKAATEILRAEMDEARIAQPPTRPVLEALKE